MQNPFIEIESRLLRLEAEVLNTETKRLKAIEFAELAGITVTRVYSIHKKSPIPGAYRSGGRLVFDRDIAVEFIAKGGCK
jgi:predicted DNA-binding transcriptional regulator AlpA